MQMALIGRFVIAFAEISSPAEPRVFERQLVRQPVIKRQQRRMRVRMPKAIRRLDHTPEFARAQHGPTVGAGPQTLIKHHMFERRVEDNEVEDDVAEQFCYVGCVCCMQFRNYAVQSAALVRNLQGTFVQIHANDLRAALGQGHYAGPRARANLKHPRTM